MQIMELIANTVIQGKLADIKALVQQAVDENIDPLSIIQDGLAAGMQEVGRRFKDNEYFLPEVMVSAKTMAAGVSVLEPLLSESTDSKAVKILVGTVKGDVHDIGKNIVIMMFRGAGFEVTDLGVNVPPEKFVEAAIEQKPDIVGLCALLSTTLPMQEITIKAFEEAKLRDKLNIIVGGAPVTQKFADKIGADGYAPDAGSAVELVKELT